MNPNLKAEMMGSISGFLADTPPFQEKSILIFGHCNATEELCDALLDLGVSPYCFLDNNQGKQGGLYRNIPIYAPEESLKFQAENSIVLIASRFFHPMRGQLLDLGYDGEIVETVEYNSFQAFSLEEGVFDQKKQRVLQGYQHLEALKQEFSEHFFVLCPHQALGDVYWVMSYLPAYCEKHQSESMKNTVILTVGNACKKVANLFTQGAVIALDQKKMDALVQAVLFVGEENALIAHHNYLYTDPSFHMIQKHFIEFTDYYRGIVLGLEEKTLPVLPSYEKELSCPEKIPQGKSVIFAPYANSVVEAPKEFWVSLAKQYEKQGFSVFTNVITGQEVVEGTKALDLPLNEMKSAVEWAGHFVSMRSGICDVVRGAKAKKTLVFPDCFYSTTKHKISDFFALEGWDRILLEEVNP